jgi:LDH2 family malate/lactate/ureidoglycolate dehydrogenase
VVTKVTGTASGGRVPAARLHRLACEVLTRIGMSAQDATMCADAMVWSDLRGATNHGVSARIPVIASRVRTGSVNPAPDWKVLASTAGVTALDADRGWGQVAGTRGMNLAVEAARRTGVGVATVCNADIAASLGWYANIAVEQSMIGIAFNNSLPIMAPWGGATKLLGNQATAMGAPARRHHPILFDSALSALSLHAVQGLLERDESLPDGAALDIDGRPTTDPAAAIAGAMLPAAGHRGYGIALMWEVLTGVLGTGLFAPEVRSPADGPVGLTLFCLALDPTAIQPLDEFTARVDTLIDRIHACAPVDGVDAVRVPGARGYAMAELQQHDGVLLTADQLSGLRNLADEFGLEWDGATGA